jgi:endogenous inhibitor of DNA gyrase (YacG/DUF329 family)
MKVYDLTKPVIRDELDGTMCAGCGKWMDDGEDGPGYPCCCEACK